MIESARAVADAVLYEGFLLFPYAKGALKNQMPFQFGVIMPQGYRDPSEPPVMRSQFIVAQHEAGARIDGLLRFLEVSDEPVEREIAFSFDPAEASRVPFQAEHVTGEIRVHGEADGAAIRVTIEVENRTAAPPGVIRNEALRNALVSAHLLLEIRGGEFASLLDPPEQFKAAASRCVNERVFPVLTGPENDTAGNMSRVLLISPIILYDFPRIAPASRARTFDGTEIDELLMLSVASLSENEKRDARAAHPYVRELVDRAEALDADTLQTLHGELTGAGKPGDERVTIDGITIGPGSRVRVQPKGRADVWDDIVRGMTARVNVVHTDFEGKRYIGVVFDADPASEMHEWYGRSFFYGSDEVEPLT